MRVNAKWRDTIVPDNSGYRQYVDDQLPLGETLTYQFRIFRFGGFSEYSCSEPVVVPGGLCFVERSPQGVTVSWRVDGSLSLNLRRNNRWLTGLALGNQSYTDTQVTRGTTYTYQVVERRLGQAPAYHWCGEVTA